MKYNEIFEAFCEEIKKRVTSVSFNAWFKDLEIIDVGADEMIIKVPDAQKVPVLEANFMKMMKEIFLNVLGFEVNVVLFCDEEKPQPISFTTPITEFDNISIRPGDTASFTFDNFIVGNSNRFAYTAAKAIVDNPYTTDYNPFFIYGPSGVGKTHLMFAIENEIKRQHPEMKSIYVRGEDFTTEFLKALFTHTMEEFNDRFRNVDIFLLDDIQFIAGKDSTQEGLFNTIDSLQLNNKQIILSSDRPPKEIRSFEERIRSRCEKGLLADIHQPDFETRVGILRYKSRALGMELSDDVVFYVAEQITKNTRQLEGIIKKILAYSNINKKLPNLTAVHSLIKDLVNDNTENKITPKTVIDEISKTYTISADDLTSHIKTADVVKARQIGMYVMREVLKMTHTDIGKEFGGRDHATVMHSINKVSNLIKSNSAERSIIEDVIQNLQNLTD